MEKQLYVGSNKTRGKMYAKTGCQCEFYGGTAVREKSLDGCAWFLSTEKQYTESKNNNKTRVKRGAILSLSRRMTAVAVRYQVYFINTNKHELCMGFNLNLIK